MKKLLAIIFAFTLVFAFSACGSNADGTATTSTIVTEETTLENALEVEVTVTEKTESETKPMAIKDVMISDEIPEYSADEENWTDIYQIIELTNPLSGEYGTIKFYYVPYADREGEMYPSYLKVEVLEKSEDFSITFADVSNEEGNLFPGNISEGFVYPNSQLTSSSNFNAYKQGTSLTLNGFQPGLKTIDMIFRNAMPAMEINIGEETYDVYCLQFIFK